MFTPLQSALSGMRTAGRAADGGAGGVWGAGVPLNLLFKALKGVWFAHRSPPRSAEEQFLNSTL